MKRKIWNAVGPLAIIGLMLPAAACSKHNSANPGEPGPTSQKGLVTGKVVDAQGHAVKNAKITIEHTVWYGTYLFATSNEQGAYQVALPTDPAGDWTAKAQLTATAYGQTYKFDLAPETTDAFNRTTGAVRNFTWKLSGAHAGDGGFYGAHVDLYQWATDADLSKMKIQFTPYPGESMLVDGSPATSFERPVVDVAGTYMVKDVPIGKYLIKAIYPGKKLLLDNRHLDDEKEESKTVVFGKNGYLGETEYNIEFYVTE